MADPNAIFQNSFYIGNSVMLILYGVELMLYSYTVWIVTSNRSHGYKHASNERRLLYLSTALLCMVTIFLAVQAVFGQEMWILHADYPGGSGQYLADHAAVWYQTLGSAAWMVLSLISDALLIYRTYLAWCDWRVIILPSILYCATAALSILNCYTSGQPNADFFVGKAAHIALAYSSIVIGLNFTCSVLICTRILWFAKRMEPTLGSDVAKTYTGAASLIIESMLPYTLFGIVYTVTLGIHHPTSIFFLSVYVMFTCLSPQMIIVRVLMGRARKKASTYEGTLPLRLGSRAVPNDTVRNVRRDRTTCQMAATSSDGTHIELGEILKLGDSASEVHSIVKNA